MVNGNIENSIIVYADISLYSKDSVFKCLYWYGDKYHTNISVCVNNGRECYKIVLKPILGETLDDDEKNDVIQKLENDLIDFNLRDIVTKETINIRELLIAKAFSNGEFDEEPQGEVSDPLGFQIE